MYISQIVGALLLSSISFLLGGLTGSHKPISIGFSIFVSIVVMLSGALLLREHDNGRPRTKIADGEYVVAMTTKRADRVFVLVEQKTSGSNKDKELNFQLYSLPPGMFPHDIPEVRSVMKIRTHIAATIGQFEGLDG